MVAQLDILETMTPLEFLSFRAASKRQAAPVGSVPAIEFVLGRKSSAAIDEFPEAAAPDRRWRSDGAQ